eukprot:TRINITY_DN19651_c0_g1_i1.p1 TRINITY_DN19651_c0_g1~~TRINITY_DN19651_c0_g1_i1.p1  ORF type:complete len:420 (-),score=115.38 TRINITY_DN19651_c0_g1_i1:11-1270(-)
MEYTLEQLTNISTVQISITSQRDDRPEVKIDCNQLGLKYEGEDPFEIPVRDCTMTGKNTTISQQGRNLSIRVGLSSTLKEEEFPLNQFVRKEEIEMISCRKCSAPLSNKSKIEKTLSLPSTYWLELTDMWICGCCGPNFDHFPLKDIDNREGTILLGETFLLMHGKNLDLTALNMQLNRTEKTKNTVKKHSHPTERKPGHQPHHHHEEDIQARYNVPIQCSKCGSHLGSAECDRDPSLISDASSDPCDDLTAKMEKLSTKDLHFFNFKILKHRIAASSIKDPDRNAFSKFCAETVVASEIFAASQAHKKYRYLVQDENGKNRILLLLTNWDGFLQMSTNPRNVDKERMVPIITVTYLECQEDASQVEKWREKYPLEELRFSSQDCDDLIDVLHRSNERQFPSLRMFQNMHRAYLRRNLP